MKVHKALFLKSCPDRVCFPDTSFPEYAFIGRSNVGKSSLINFLCGQKNLAKTSSTPGRTRLANFFQVDDAWMLVDLPGYGYAKTDKSTRSGISKVIQEYLENRPQLCCLMVLIDSRLKPQQSDLDFIDKCGMSGVPIALVFTKTDKISRNLLPIHVENFKKQMLRTWEELPPIFTTSSTKKIGDVPILQFISEVNGRFNKKT